MRVVIFDNDDYESLLEHKSSHDETYEHYDEACHEYKEKYGMHFNEKLMKFAVSAMKCRNSSTGELESILPISKAELDSMLVSNGITINNNKLYDYVYVANICKADFYDSSIIDEKHLCLYVKDVIDDPDGYEGIVFNRWLSDMKEKAVNIDWEKLL